MAIFFPVDKEQLSCAKCGNTSFRKDQLFSYKEINGELHERLESSYIICGKCEHIAQIISHDNIPKLKRAD